MKMHRGWMLVVMLLAPFAVGALAAVSGCEMLGRDEPAKAKPVAAAEPAKKPVPPRLVSSAMGQIIRANAKMPDGSPYVGPSWKFKARFLMQPEDGRLQTWKLQVEWIRPGEGTEAVRTPVLDLTVRGGAAVELTLPQGEIVVAAEVTAVDRKNGRNEDFLPISIPCERNESGELDVGDQRFELTELGKLLGKVMPEWQVAEGHNTSKFQISDYRGKWVLLHFWGYWCKFCVGESVPQLMDFYEKHADLRGAYEIIAFHDESVATMAELDQKIKDKGVAEELWGGRSLPFPVLLSGHEKRKTVEWLRPRVFPTICLIDPEGRLVKIGATERDVLEKIAPDRVKDMTETPPRGS